MVRVGPITEKEKYFVCTFAGLECLFFVKHFPFLNDFEFDLNLTMLSPSMRIKKKTATNLVCLKLEKETQPLQLNIRQWSIQSQKQM